jgi:hypothetical protein
MGRDMLVDAHSQLAILPRKIDDVLSKVDSASEAHAAFCRSKSPETSLDGTVSNKSDSELERFLRLLEMPDIRSNHQRHHDVRQPGTGSWVFAHEEFVCWSMGNVHNLWIHGIRKYPIA